ncbi:Metallo-dependent hydrolase [Amylostereum chailletii]|nr:Metallo-dependent hydrolase [Amylostereum chailletii]
MSNRKTLFYGPVINPDSLSSYQALPRCLLAVNAAGDIDWIENDVEPSRVPTVRDENKCQDADFVELQEGEFIMPGFVDTHTHAPQVPNIGSGQQYELLDWLNNVTFPMEAQFSDVDFARKAYGSVVRRIVDSGTTTCCYYGTLHLEATKVLADIVYEYGQRAFVGKCNMDRMSPDNYIEPSVASSIAATEKLIEHIHGFPTELVQPVITPRFAISCTGPLLKGLGDLAHKHPTMLVQTHISENTSEITTTRELFPECASYADVYYQHGLLGPRTVLAHAVHLEESEVELIRKQRSGVSHCPTSNFNLRSGICPVGKLLDQGIKVGLGTDVSGGFSTSILTEVQHASVASKVLAFQAPATSALTTDTFANRQLSVATCLHLATLGGAQVCGLEKRVGSFAPGKAFDALLVAVHSDAGNPRLWGMDLDDSLGIKRAGTKVEAMLERFLFTGDDRNIRKVFVQGRWIGGAKPRLQEEL